MARRRIGLFFCVTIVLFGWTLSRPARAWYFPEHAEITRIALTHYAPQPTAEVFVELIRLASMGDTGRSVITGTDDAARQALFARGIPFCKDPGQLLHEVPLESCTASADPNLPLSLGGKCLTTPYARCIPYGALPALAGDHSLTNEELMHLLTEEVTRGPLPSLVVAGMVTGAAVQSWRDLRDSSPADFNRIFINPPESPLAAAQAGSGELNRTKLVRDLDARMLLVDHDYTSRAMDNRTHFHQAGVSMRELLRQLRDSGVVDNALNQMLTHHIRSLLVMMEAAEIRGQAESAKGGAKRELEKQLSTLVRVALLEHAFAVHFMEDGFSSGHVATEHSIGKAESRLQRHDYLCRVGLSVTRALAARQCDGAVNDFCWTAIGDGYLDGENLPYMAKAVAVMQLELAAAFRYDDDNFWAASWGDDVVVTPVASLLKESCGDFDAATSHEACWDLGLPTSRANDERRDYGIPAPRYDLSDYRIRAAVRELRSAYETLSGKEAPETPSCDTAAPAAPGDAGAKATPPPTLAQQKTTIEDSLLNAIGCAKKAFETARDKAAAAKEDEARRAAARRQAEEAQKALEKKKPAPPKKPDGKGQDDVPPPRILTLPDKTIGQRMMDEEAEFKALKASLRTAWEASRKLRRCEDSPNCLKAARLLHPLPRWTLPELLEDSITRGEPGIYEDGGAHAIVKRFRSMLAQLHREAKGAATTPERPAYEWSVTSGAGTALDPAREQANRFLKDPLDPCGDVEDTGMSSGEDDVTSRIYETLCYSQKQKQPAGDDRFLSRAVMPEREIAVSLWRPLLVVWPTARMDVKTIDGLDPFGKGLAYQVAFGGHVLWNPGGRRETDPSPLLLGGVSGLVGVSYRFDSLLAGRDNRAVFELNVGMSPSLFVGEKWEYATMAFVEVRAPLLTLGGLGIGYATRSSSFVSVANARWGVGLNGARVYAVLPSLGKPLGLDYGGWDLEVAYLALGNDKPRKGGASDGLGTAYEIRLRVGGLNDRLLFRGHQRSIDTSLMVGLEFSGGFSWFFGAP